LEFRKVDQAAARRLRSEEAAGRYLDLMDDIDELYRHAALGGSRVSQLQRRPLFRQLRRTAEEFTDPVAGEAGTMMAELFYWVHGAAQEIQETEASVLHRTGRATRKVISEFRRGATDLVLPPEVANTHAAMERFEAWVERQLLEQAGDDVAAAIASQRRRKSSATVESP
jgi:hypothetical protein